MTKWMDYKGSKLCYQSYGEGFPVVLLHGFGESSAVWQKQISALQGYQLLIPDLPGSGQSEMIEDMSMEGLATAVYQLLKGEAVQQCIMIGHSMGGYITLAFADQYKNMLKGFGLFHSTAYADTEEKKATRKKGIAGMRQQGAAAFLKTTIPQLYSQQTKATAFNLIEEQVQSAQATSTEASIAYYQAMIERRDRTAVLSDSKVPVLFILGKWDSAVPLRDGLQQCYLPDLSYIHILPASGHMGMQEEWEKANEFLTRFLSDTLKSQQDT